MAADELDDAEHTSALLRAYRDEAGPAPARKERNWAALGITLAGAGVGAGAAAGVGGGAAAASGGFLSVHGTKLAVALLAVALVGGSIAVGAGGLTSPSPAASPSERASEPPASTSPTLGSDSHTSVAAPKISPTISRI